MLNSFAILKKLAQSFCGRNGAYFWNFTLALNHGYIIEWVLLVVRLMPILTVDVKKLMQWDDLLAR